MKSAKNHPYLFRHKFRRCYVDQIENRSERVWISIISIIGTLPKIMSHLSWRHRGD